MRIIIDSLIAFMLVLILGGVLVHYRKEQGEILKYQQVHHALASLEEQAIYRGAMMETTESSPEQRRFPSEVSPTWFGNGTPMNVMVTAGHPWLDIAPRSDRNDHPPDPVITRPDQAGFWYNPSRGLFRARVMPQFTEEETLDLYNELNGTSLHWLPKDSDPALKPHTPLAKAAPNQKTDHADATARAAAATTSASDDDDDAKSGQPPKRTTLVDNPPR